MDKFPQYDSRLRGGDDLWDSPAGALLRSGFFATVDPEEPIDDPPGPKIDLKYQCQWCDNDADALGFCVPCGDKAGKCRAPRYASLQARLENDTVPAWNLSMSSSSVGCCGNWASTVPAIADPYPFLQWGYHRHYRYRNTARYENSRQDGNLSFQYYDEKPVSDYKLFTTGAGAAIWHYWFKLDSYRVTMFPKLVGDACKLRVVVEIVGTHNVAQVVRWRTSDGRPNTGCHTGILTGIAGIEYANYSISTACLVGTESGGACPTIFTGTNPNAGIMDWYEEQPWEEPNLPVQYSVRQMFCRDFDRIPVDPMSLSLFVSTGCNAGPCETLDNLTPTIAGLSWPTWENASSSGSRVCNNSVFAATLGTSPHGDCDTPGAWIRRFIQCETGDTYSEAMAGSSPATSITPADLGSWTLQFLPI
jgi:hypothetical protein